MPIVVLVAVLSGDNIRGYLIAYVGTLFGGWGGADPRFEMCCWEVVPLAFINEMVVLVL